MLAFAAQSHRLFSVSNASSPAHNSPAFTFLYRKISSCANLPTLEPTQPAPPPEQQSKQPTYPARLLLKGTISNRDEARRIRDRFAQARKEHEKTLPSAKKKKTVPEILQLPTDQRTKNFTKEEDEKLLNLVHLYGQDWERVSKSFGPTRGRWALWYRYSRKLQRTHPHWVISEKEQLGNMAFDQVQRYFFEQAQKFGEKKGPFSRFEEDVLLELYRCYGRQWKLMEHVFAGRRSSEQLSVCHKVLESRGMKRSNDPVQLELDIPEEIPRGDPSWTSREIYEMQKIVDRSRKGMTIDPSELTRLFPGRTNEEIDTMRKWVFEDTYDQWLGGQRRWTWQERKVLAQFVEKYGIRRWNVLYKSRALPGRSVDAMRYEYRTNLMGTSRSKNARKPIPQT